MGMARADVPPKVETYETALTLSSSSTNRVTFKKESWSNYGFAFLWTIVTPDESTKDVNSVLREIYGRLQTNCDPGLIVPASVQNSLKVLGDSKVHPKNKALLCHVLRILITSELYENLFVKYGLHKVIYSCMEQWARLSRRPTKDECLLLDSHLALFETLTYRNRDVKRELLDLGALHIFCQLCSPQCLATFTFGNEYYATFEHWALGIFPDVIGQLAIVHSDVQREAYEESMGEDFEQLNLPEEVYLVNLFNTSNPDEDVNVAEKLKKTKGAWPLISELVPTIAEDPVSVVSEEEWGNLFVTTVATGCMFWAQVKGQESLSLVQRVAESLESWENKKALSEPPEVSSLFAMRDKSLGFARFQVTEEIDETTVRAFAMDYGSTHDIVWEHESVFQIEPEMGLDDIPSQAHLCILKGVSSPPRDVKTLQKCIAIIRNLGTEAANYNSNEYFGSKKMIHTLEFLCFCPEPVMVRVAAQIIVNISHSHLMKAKLLGVSMEKTLIRALKRLQPKAAEEDAARAVYSIISALSSMIHDCVELADAFVHAGGLKAVLMLANVEGLHSQARSAICKLLRTYLRGADPSVLIHKIKNRQRINASILDLRDLESAIIRLGLRRKDHYRIGSSVSDSDARVRPGSRTKSLGSTDAGHESSGGERPDRHGKGVNGRKPRSYANGTRKEGALSPESLAQEQDEDEEDIIARIIGKNRGRPKTSISGNDTSDGEILASLSKPLRGSDGENIRILDTAEVFKLFSKRVAFVKGRKVPFTNDVNHDIRPFETVRHIAKNQILSAVVGLLNTGGGGRIFIGIQIDGIVNGIEIDRGSRDTLRTSVDAILTTTIPTVTCLYYEVKYHQVIKEIKTAGSEQPKYCAIKDLYVIELTINPTIDMVYTTQQGEIYLRRDGSTDEITMQELHEFAILKEEARMLSQIETLKKELSIWSGQPT